MSSVLFILSEVLFAMSSVLFTMSSVLFPTHRWLVDCRCNARRPWFSPRLFLHFPSSPFLFLFTMSSVLFPTHRYRPCFCPRFIRHVPRSGNVQGTEGLLFGLCCSARSFTRGTCGWSNSACTCRRYRRGEASTQGLRASSRPSPPPCPSRVDTK
jgi:hypothetical protein